MKKHKSLKFCWFTIKKLKLSQCDLAYVDTRSSWKSYNYKHTSPGHNSASSQSQLNLNIHLLPVTQTWGVIGMWQISTSISALSAYKSTFIMLKLHQRIKFIIKVLYFQCWVSPVVGECWPSASTSKVRGRVEWNMTGKDKHLHLGEFESLSEQHRNLQNTW